MAVREARPGYYVAGQVSDADLTQLAGPLGCKTVINLRQPKEETFRDEASICKQLALDFHHVPVDINKLTFDVVNNAISVVDSSAKPLLVHCALGRRAVTVVILHALRDMLPTDNVQEAVENTSKAHGLALTQSAADTALRDFMIAFCTAQLAQSLKRLTPDVFLAPHGRFSPSEWEQIVKDGRLRCKAVLSVDKPSRADDKDVAEKAGLSFRLVADKAGKDLTWTQHRAIEQALSALPHPVLVLCNDEHRNQIEAFHRLKHPAEQQPQQGPEKMNESKDDEAHNAQKRQKTENRVMVKCIPHAATSTCTYVVWDKATKKSVLIDSAVDFDQASGKISYKHAASVLSFIRAEGLSVIYLLETHVHADHLSAAQYFKQQLQSSEHKQAQQPQPTQENPPICIGHHVIAVQKHFANAFDLSSDILHVDGSSFDRLLKEGDVLSLGEHTIRVIETPGHTPACVTYIIDDALFSGDTLFMPDLGTARCDFPGGSAQAMWASTQKLLSFPPLTRMFVAHDYPPAGEREFAWEVTVIEQNAYNKMVKAGTQSEQYIQVRNTRDATLSPPGLLYPSLQVNIAAGRLPTPHPNGMSYLVLPLTVARE